MSNSCAHLQRTCCKSTGEQAIANSFGTLSMIVTQSIAQASHVSDIIAHMHARFALLVLEPQAEVHMHPTVTFPVATHTQVCHQIGAPGGSLVVTEKL